MESSSLSLSLATPSEPFEALKKAARKYESQAYTKLTEYGRLAQQTVAASQQAIQHQQQLHSTSAASNSHSSFSTYSSASTATSDSASLLVSSPSSASSSSSSSSSSLLAALPSPSELERDISDLLAKLAATTDDMSRALAVDSGSSGGAGSLVASETNQYTVQRYRAILHDYNNEFRKTRDNINNARQRAELLLSTAPLTASSTATSQLRPRTEQLLREKSSLHHSLRVTDELLSTAAASHSSLLQQSSSLFHTIRGKVSGLRARYPAVSSLISRIERQRRKDVIVMGSVIAACICFTSLYIINKPA